MADQRITDIVNELTALADEDWFESVDDSNISEHAEGSTAKVTLATLRAGIAMGLQWKQPVRVATTANGTLATAFENGDTVDGVTLATGDRILLKDQTTQADRGIYVVQASGAPTRANDANTGPRLVGAAVIVTEGTANADTLWFCTTNSPITVGVTSLAFSQVSGGGITALTSDVTATGPGSAAATIAANAVTDAKFRQSAGLSLVGRSANSTGNVADITAANDGEVMRRSGTAIGFGTVATAGLANDAVTYAKIQNVSATDNLLGRSTAGAGDVEEIACTAAGRALIDDANAAAQRTTLGLGTVATLASDTDGTLAANSNSNVATQKAVKTYVDANAGGVTSWKQTVRAATTANGTLATAYENGDTIDGVILATGNRILIKDQTSGAENGIYVVAASGAGTRATDCDSAAEILGATVVVQEGTANADTIWYSTTNTPIVLGTSPTVWARVYNGISALTGDVTATGPGSVAATIAANAVSDTKLRDSAALSVIGRSANSAGDPADIAAGSDGYILRRSGTTLAFGTIAAAGITDAVITFAKMAANTIREVLTADRTYYVRSDGSDSNTGLANSAGGAFLTVQKAVNVAVALDLATYSVTIQLGAATRTEQVVLKDYIGTGPMYIVGDETTPSNCTFNATSGSCFAADGVPHVWHIRGVKMTTTTYGQCIQATSGSKINFQKCDFGTCAGYQVYSHSHSSITVTDNYTISGGALVHWFGALSGKLESVLKTITLSGTPAFSVAFLSLSEDAMLYYYLNTFSGSATGTRYTVGTNSVAQTNGAGTTALPGNAAGSTPSGGQYV